jgi:hypothetical protein
MDDLEEAVARFFSRGTSYDRVEAQRLIQWLDKCGYKIVPKEQPHVATEGHAKKPASPRSVRTKEWA